MHNQPVAPQGYNPGYQPAPQYDFQNQYRPAYVSPPPFSDPNLPKVKPQKTKRYLLPLILAGLMLLVAITSFLFAMYNIEQAKKLTEQNRALSQSLSGYKQIIEGFEKSTGKKVQSAEDLKAFTAQKNAIYLNDWELQLRVPIDFPYHLSYMYEVNPLYPKLCLTAQPSGLAKSPAYANMAARGSGLGCIVRMPEEKAKPDDKRFTQFAFNIDGFNFFFIAPAKPLSVDPAELETEKTIAAAVKLVLIERNNYHNY